MSWFTQILPTLTTAIGQLTPQQLRQLSGGVTQAVETQEMQLIQEISDNPATGAGALPTLTAISGVPPAAVSWVESALSAWAAGDKNGFANDLAQAKAVILAQRINMF